MQLRPALDQFDVRYVTTDLGLGVREQLRDVREISDANRSSGINAVKCFFQAWWIVWRTRPDVVISTGAMPGLFCLAAGRALGARTIWLDSVANAEKLSMSGAAARRCATLWLTQWEHLSTAQGPFYQGSIL